MLSELDTINDFLDYLNRKNRLIECGRLGVSSGEENLLAYYITHVMAHGRNDFPELPEGMRLSLAEDLWSGLSAEFEYLQLKERLRPSYAWDQIVQELAQDILAGQMTAGNEGGVSGHERRVRALASASRRVRADLAVNFAALLRDDSYPTRFRAIQHPSQQDTAYLFLVLSRDNMATEAYRQVRGNVMRAYCMAFAHRNSNIRHVVGISTGPSSSCDDTSHEVVYIDRQEWTPDDDALAEHLEREYKIFRNVKARSLS